MAFLTQAQLDDLPFKHLGKNVKISTITSFYNTKEISIGDNSRIDDFCLLKGPLVIGRYSHVSPFCLISASLAPILIDDFVGISYSTSIFTSSDDYSGATLSNPLIPAEFKDVAHGAVIIKKHVLVGANSIIMPGVIVGEGCAIGALTYVNHSTNPWGIYAGIPAKRIKERKQDLLKLEEEFLKTV